jgi:fused signal recognition particle receptor
MLGFRKKKNEQAAVENEQSTSWLSRLSQGLKKTASSLTEGLGAVLTKRKLDAATLDGLEELLITADFGVATAQKIVSELKKSRFDQEVSEEEVRQFLADAIATRLAPYAKPLEINPSHRPHVIVMVGVNGTGKTTSTAKLAHQFCQEGKKVVLAAADTFRAAAVEQLIIWGQRSGCAVITGEQNADPASVAFRAYEEAVAQNADVLIVDTAGRLHNKTGLMQELQKITRVLGKTDATAPHNVLLVLDATTGQNAHNQLSVFKEMVQVTGLIITKLDGSAKGGVVVALADAHHLPIHAIGVGEGMEDQQAFDAQSFAEQLMFTEA